MTTTEKYGFDTSSLLEIFEKSLLSNTFGKRWKSSMHKLVTNLNKE